MNCYKIVLTYIEDVKDNEPIFVEDVKKYAMTFYEKEDFPKVYNNVKVILNRMKKEGIIKQVEKGVYYKPMQTIWGRESVPPMHKIRDYKYIIDKDGNIKGYITGAKLFNLLGLTTQIPNVIDIATNECPNNNKYLVARYNVMIRKPKIEVNNDNYQYLQLLDILTNDDEINIEVNDENDILYKYIKKNGLEFEKLLKYARETKNKKVLTKLWILAR